MKQPVITKTWSQTVAPVVDRLMLVAKLDLTASFGADGAEALADLLSQMARVIDEEVVRRQV